MDKIVDHVFEYKGDGTIKDFPGNYTQLRESNPDYDRPAITDAKEQKKREKTRGSQGETGAKPTHTYKEKKAIEALEEELRVAGSEKQRLEEEISSGSLAAQILREKSERLGELLKLIDEMEMRWLELNER
jgi:ATP-binding cassette subfamily F protein uup